MVSISKNVKRNFSSEKEKRKFKVSPAGRTNIDQSKGTAAAGTKPDFRTTIQGDRFDFNLPISSKDFSSKESYIQAKRIKIGAGGGGFKDKEKEKPIIEKPIQTIQEEQEAPQVSKRIEKGTVTIRDESGNVVRTLTQKEALQAGIVKGITGEEQAGQLVEVGLTAGGIAAGIGAVGGAVGARAIKTLNANKLSKFKNAFPTTTDDIIKYGKDTLKTKKASFGAAKGKALYGLGALYGINEFLLSPSELATWAAIDNIAGQAAFLTRDISDAVKFSNMPIDEANKAFDRAEESIGNSKKFITRTTILNPKLWANSKILRQTIIEAEARVELSRMEVNGFRESQGGVTDDREQ